MGSENPPTTKQLEEASSAITEQEKEAPKDEEPYTIFSTFQQIRFLTICALTSMISPLTASIYVPALNQIQEALHTTTENVNLTVTVYMIFQAISPTFWGTIADSYGRRPVLMSTMVAYCGACIGLALSKNYATLLICRMLQAFGSSSVIAIGAGILSDIADTKKRGSYFGVYSIGQLLGPVLGPVLGGIFAQELGWKWIFWFLLILGSSSFVFVGLFVPETLRSLVGNGAGYANPTPWQWLLRRRGKLDEVKIAKIKQEAGPRRPMNFLQPFIFLTEPDLFLALLFNGMLYMSFYFFLVSTTKQFSLRYNLNELQIGLCFLSQGVGTILGSFVKGRFLDRELRNYNRKLKEKGLGDESFSYYRARLGSCWISLIFADTMPIVYGWCMYINAPLPVPLVLQFLTGFSTSSTTVCVQTLIVDLFPGKGASITASNNLMRCLLGAIATVCIDPGIENLGIGWMFTIVGLCVTLVNILVPVLLKFGPIWKKTRDERLKLNNGQMTFSFFHLKK